MRKFAIIYEEHWSDTTHCHCPLPDQQFLLPIFPLHFEVRKWEDFFYYIRRKVPHISLLGCPPLNEEAASSAASATSSCSASSSPPSPPPLPPLLRLLLPICLLLPPPSAYPSASPSASPASYSPPPPTLHPSASYSPPLRLTRLPPPPPSTRLSDFLNIVIDDNHGNATGGGPETSGVHPTCGEMLMQSFSLQKFMESLLLFMKKALPLPTS